MIEGLRKFPTASTGPVFLWSDHYYLVTAMLAARGLQVWVCRLVAAWAATLGLIPVALLLSPLGPDNLSTRIGVPVLLVSCLSVSVLWLRYRWPTRAQSMISMVVGSLVIGISALLAANPVVGFLAASTFVITTLLVVFFHTPRLLTVIWTIAAVVVGVLFSRLASTDLWLAVWATAMVLVLNAFSGVACWGIIRLIQPDVHHGDSEPLTGLLHRDGFYHRVATLLASRSRSHDKYMVLVAVNIDSFSLLLGMTGSRGGDKARVAVSQALRETVRHNAIVAHIADDVFLVADTFTTADASPLVERIRGAIAVTPQRLTASIGIVCTPLAPLVIETPDHVVDQLIEAAMAAVEEARLAGGDQARYVVLQTLDEDEDDRPDTDETA